MSKVIIMNQDGVEVKVKNSVFPAGEVYVKILEPELVTPKMTVVLLSADSEHIMRAIMLADALKRVTDDGCIRCQHMTLYTPYMPYGRQDRVCSTGESSSLSAFLDIMAIAGYRSFKTLDIHNHAPVKGWVTNEHVDYALYLQSLPEGTIIVSPDKGAVERCQRASRGQYPVAILGKERLAGGGIKQYPLLPADIELIANAKSLLIVDDICDGGATFINAAQVLHEHNPTAELHLFVTHGIFSQGMEKLEAVFDSVRCVNRYIR